MYDESGESTQEDDVTGAGRGELETETETVMRLTERSRDEVRHLDRNDQLYVARMMLMVERE